MREERDVDDDERDHRADLDAPNCGDAACPHTGKRLAMNITERREERPRVREDQLGRNELRQRDGIADESAVEVALDRVEHAR